MCITRIPVRKSRPPTRRPTPLYARSSTVPGNRSLEHGKSVLRINQGSSVGHRRIRKQLERIGRRRAQGRRPPPDAGTRTRAFTAPVAFSPNPPVTGSVIGSRHPSCHSFCSLPHQTSQNVAGRREWVGTSNQGLPRDAQGQRSG